MKTKLYKIIIKLVLRIHNLSYKLSGFLSQKIERGIHPKHRLMDYHKFFVDRICSQDIVWDIGCGNGALSFDVAKKSNKVIGIDLNKKNIEFAKKNFFLPNINYITGDALNYAPDDKIDVIILSNVLEHIEDRVKFLNKIKEQSPKILIRVPMINRDWITLYKKELNLDWKLDKSHFIEYSLESFREELKKAGLMVQDYTIQFGEIWSVVIKI